MKIALKEDVEENLKDQIENYDTEISDNEEEDNVIDENKPFLYLLSEQLDDSPYNTSDQEEKDVLDNSDIDNVDAEDESNVLIHTSPPLNGKDDGYDKTSFNYHERPPLERRNSVVGGYIVNGKFPMFYKFNISDC